MSVRPLLRGLTLPLAPRVSTRSISFFGWGSSKKEDTPTESSTPSRQRSITDMLKSSAPSVSSARAAEQQAMPTRGKLAETSIFGDETVDLPEATNNIDLVANRKFRDPFRDTWGWPRRHQMRVHRKRGRLSRVEEIAQTEKEHTVKSEQMKTSLKKMTLIARQIAGKSIEDAIVQMRFSKKAIAKPVLEHLKMARDEAVVRMDMDPAEMYVDQAWVGRGIVKLSPNHRAKGRIDTLRHQHTCGYPWCEEMVGFVLTRCSDHGGAEGEEDARTDCEGEGGASDAQAGAPASSQQTHQRPAAVLPLVDTLPPAKFTSKSPRKLLYYFVYYSTFLCLPNLCSISPVHY